MAARRLIALLVVLLVISSIAAALAPTPAERDGESSTTTSTTSDRAGGDDEAGAGSSRLIEATAEVPPPRGEDGAPERAPEPVEIDASPGDQLALTVKSEQVAAVEIPELGLFETASPGGPARFDVLLREPGRIAVLAEGGRQVAAITVADPDEPKPKAGGRDRS